MHHEQERLLADGGNSQAVLARAVAARCEPSISAISPNTSPGDKVSTIFPSRSISTSPVRITYLSSPLSPSEKILSPS
jgi:hypothetical protein